MKVDLSPVGRARVVLGTLSGTLFCVAVVLLIDSFNFQDMSSAELTHALLMDILLPMGLAGPLLFFLLSKMRQLAITQNELAILAATDSLTEIYNRGAFKMLVDSYINNVRADSRNGAFLVIDADHFKTINDRFGHDKGDGALRLIAQTIKNSLRGGDIVGRIGGEEFGVFLPGATRAHAGSVAERIRSSVEETVFAANGRSVALSVSIGGVHFDRATNYQEIFRLADEYMYAAKTAGRNLVRMTQLKAIP